MGLNEQQSPGRSAPGVPGRGAAEPDAVRVDIGELVLDGFGHGVDGDRVSAAFQAELTRLVREHGVPLADADRSLDALPALPALPAGLSSRRLGQELARLVHEGLSGRGEARPGARTERGGVR
ncbi:hypothetical protein SLNWT_4722 [Streptomyces albus]|uniref:Uncharacterized protein n=1 Tax=Streptomyces albus (strain ATCC 21838 / DSM 41398 / FERM P-419 / JCM 4703 / NBRC 107858) TaxID=1081613 RepID=A0A0B5EQN8_STRA4|nr:hypothetical protein SLNWT_4722 [Streptomyces albus]AOU79405.1 hypothetical protein SLNHY_4714 [Streptomyces albus]AYN35132.1 hypothetical protein DUI70_4634 [Streptomyces albus]